MTDPTRPKMYIVHPGTGTAFAADECIIALIDDPTKPVTNRRRVPHPDFVLSFEPNAIREHYQSIDAGEVPLAPVVAAMSDDDLLEVADRAMTDDRLYIAFHDVIDDTLADWFDADAE